MTTKTKGIARPGAKRLTLPLVERHSYAYADCSSEENLITLASSRWTISAGPRSSASLYSQESYSLSPPAFSDNKVDRRRFGIALTPAQEGPWTRAPVQPQTNTDSYLFLLDLQQQQQSAIIMAKNPFLCDHEVETEVEPVAIEKGDYKALEDVRVEPEREAKVVEEKSKQNIEMQVTLPAQAKSSDVHTEDNVLQRRKSTKSKNLRLSSKVIGKMMTRLSFNSQSVEDNGEEQQPLLLPSNPPPQITIHLPSPGLKLHMNSPKFEQQQITEDDLRAFILEKHAAAASASASASPAHKRSTFPSKWKPARPPSPIPFIALGRRGKHKRNALSLPHAVADSSASPPPPLPPCSHFASLAKAAATGTGAAMHTPTKSSPMHMGGSYCQFSTSATPLHSASDDVISSPDQDASRWAEVRRRLKARALKSSTYAIHDGGVMSPTSPNF